MYMELIFLPQIPSMEALSWKTAMIGRIAFEETNLKEFCNCNARNLPSQLDIICLQDSSQQPSQPHPKSFSTTSPFLRIFSHHRGIEEKVGEDTKPNSRALKNEVSQSNLNGSDGNYQILLSLCGVAEAGQRNGKSDTEGKTGAERRNTKTSNPGNHSDSMEGFLKGEESYLPLSKPDLEIHEAQLVCGDANRISSDAENKHIESDQSNQERNSSWVLKFMDLRSYFKDENS